MSQIYPDAAKCQALADEAGASQIDLGRATVSKIVNGKPVSPYSLVVFLKGVGVADAESAYREYVALDPADPFARSAYSLSRSMHQRGVHLRKECPEEDFLRQAFSDWLDAMRKIAEWRSTVEHESANGQPEHAEFLPALLGAMRHAIASVGFDVIQLGERRATFRATNLNHGKTPIHGKDDFTRCWENILRLAANSQDSKLRLVSEGDLAFWWNAMTRPGSREAQHVKPLTSYSGERERVLIIYTDSSVEFGQSARNGADLNRSQFAERTQAIIAWMEQTCGFVIHVVHGSKMLESTKAALSRVGRRDFGIMGAAAFGYFESRGLGDDRALVEWFDESRRSCAIEAWNELVSEAVWHSGEPLELLPL